MTFKDFVVIGNLATFRELVYIPHSDLLHYWNRIATISPKCSTKLTSKNVCDCSFPLERILKSTVIDSLIYSYFSDYFYLSNLANFIFLKKIHIFQWAKLIDDIHHNCYHITNKPIPYLVTISIVYSCFVCYGQFPLVFINFLYLYKDQWCFQCFFL